MKIAPYGSWQSPLNVKLLFEQPSAPMYPQYYRGRYYWVEARAREGGRSVLVRRNPDGTEACLTPEGFNIRTRVHEYGGKCFILAKGCVYFSNDSDQRLYVQPLENNAPAQPLTVDTDKSRAYADLQLSPSGRYLLAVMEATYGDAEHQNALVGIDLNRDEPVEPMMLVYGADFYANPVVDKVGSRLAWIQWNHPYMPWDRSKLFVANIIDSDTELRVTESERIVEEKESSICQLGFYGSDLVFAMDKAYPVEPCDNYWNLYCYKDGVVHRLTCNDKEYGAPHWVFGETNHAATNGSTLLAKRIDEDGDELVRIERFTGEQTRVVTDFDSLTQLSRGRNSGEVLLIASSPTEAPQMVVLNTNGGVTRVKSVDTLIRKEEISIGTPIEYPTRDGEVAHAYYYVPHNTKFSAPADQLPPLLVTVHGGPTSRTTRSLDLSRQYWTGTGFAVLDVNHRGSTGYGRRYRQHLLGKWGQVDVDDIIDGIDYLVNQSLVDPTKVFIRGKSAGGYAVLRALTEYPQKFCAGACYYGIGNLSTLAAITHKFEARYTDRLIGEEYDENRAKSADSEYYKRSPIHFMSKARSPMILFQGLEDLVVPPDVSREVVRALVARNIDHEYVEYPGEGHGFRKSETNIDAIQRETRFYRRILGLP
ncbi:MAG: prolyl oligopeptidase family serine peptidase [Arenicellales bacterium]|nr:prolyl oligopeptidase family serine peptidase [Arenicellales bacterium]